MTDQANRITKVRPGHNQVDKAFDYLSKLLRVACRPGFGAKLGVPVQRICNGHNMSFNEEQQGPTKDKDEQQPKDAGAEQTEVAEEE